MNSSAVKRIIFNNSQREAFNVSVDLLLIFFCFFLEVTMDNTCFLDM